MHQRPTSICINIQHPICIVVDPPCTLFNWTLESEEAAAEATVAIQSFQRENASNDMKINSVISISQFHHVNTSRPTRHLILEATTVNMLRSERSCCSNLYHNELHAQILVFEKKKLMFTTSNLSTWSKIAKTSSSYSIRLYSSSTMCMHEMPPESQLLFATQETLTNTLESHIPLVTITRSFLKGSLTQSQHT